MEVDALVVGGGAAGLAAAGWLGRYRRRTLLVDADEGRNRWADALHGLPGSDRASPHEFRARAREEVEEYPDVQTRAGRVGSLRRVAGGFLATVEDEEVRARRVVLATGVRDVFPDVENFFDFYGCDVHHCPSCDGYEARDREVAVLGWRRDVAGFAVSLLDWATRVRLVTDGRALDCDDAVRAALASHRVEIHEETAVALSGSRGALESVTLASGAEVPCSMAFFSIAHEPHTGLAVGLGCELDAEGYVSVDSGGVTSVPGVYAAGDVTPGMQLLAVAVGEGTLAGVSCALSLQGEEPLPNRPAPAPDPDRVVEGDA